MNASSGYRVFGTVVIASTDQSASRMFARRLRAAVGGGSDDDRVDGGRRRGCASEGRAVAAQVFAMVLPVPRWPHAGTPGGASMTSTLGSTSTGPAAHPRSAPRRD